MSRELNPWSDEDRYYLQGFGRSQLTLPVADESFGVSLRSTTGPPRAHPDQRVLHHRHARRPLHAAGQPDAERLHLRPPRSQPAGSCRRSTATLTPAGRRVVPDLPDPLREPRQPAVHPAHREPSRHREAVADRARRISALGEILWSPPATPDEGSQIGRYLAWLAQRPIAPSTATTSCTAGRSATSRASGARSGSSSACAPRRRTSGSSVRSGCRAPSGSPGARLNYAEHMLGEEATRKPWPWSRARRPAARSS